MKNTQNWRQNPEVTKALNELKTICLNNLAVIEHRMDKYNDPNMVDNYLPLMNERKKLVIQIIQINSQL